MKIERADERRTVELTVSDILNIRIALMERTEHYRKIMREVWETQPPKEAVKRDKQLQEFSDGFRWALKSIKESEKQAVEGKE